MNNSKKISLKNCLHTISKWYKKDQNGNRNEVAITIFESLLFLPLVIIEGIKVGIYASYNKGADVSPLKGLLVPFIKVLQEKGNNISYHTNSFHNYRNTNYISGYLLIFLLVYATICIINFIYKDRNKNLSYKKDGWMQFMNHDEFNELYAYHTEDGKIQEPDELDRTPGNMILSKDIRYHLAGTTTTYSCALICGAIGSGKTFTYVKPNILQMNSSYIVTDPKGELTRDCGQALMNHGYRVKVLNIDQDTMMYSCKYNPFKYIRDNESLISLVNVFIENTNHDDKAAEDPFFGPAEKNFYLMLFFYVYTVYKDQPEKQTFKEVYELYSLADETEQPKPARGQQQKPTENEFDKRFRELAETDPTNPALGYYNTFKNGSPKTKQSILISAGIRLWFMGSGKVANLLSDDEMELETLGDRKTAVFVILKAEDQTFNFIAAMFFTQLFNMLYYTGNIVNEKSWLLTYGNFTALRSKVFIPGTQSEQDEKKSLEELRETYLKAHIESDEGSTDPKFTTPNEMGLTPWRQTRIVTNDNQVLHSFNSKKEAELFMHVIKHGKIEKGKKCLTCHTRFMLDEFANIGKIPDFDKKLATFRSLRISADIIVQSIAQLKEMYDDRQSKIISNCSITILLGSNDIDDCKWWSDQVGQTTIRSKSINIDNKGLIQGSSGGSISENAQLLMRPEEIRSMPGDQSLIIVQGQMPIKDKKYKAIDHPNWNETDQKFEYERLFCIEQKQEAIPQIKLHVLNTPVEQGPAIGTNPTKNHPYNNPLIDSKTNKFDDFDELFQNISAVSDSLKKQKEDMSKDIVNLKNVGEKTISVMDDNIKNGKATLKNNVYTKTSIADELASFIDF